MPSFTIPDETFNQLAKRAASLNVTVEQLIQRLAAESAANEQAIAPPVPTFEEWKKKFDAWMADVQARADRYPPGFVLDDSRESMYEGCGE